VQLCYITARRQFTDDETANRYQLLDKIAEAAQANVDYIQLRERDLPTAELEPLARQALHAIRGTRTRLLINSRTDVALAVGAHGVHIRSDDISPAEVRSILPAQIARDFVISVACHSVDDVRHAASAGATFALLAPIFEKNDASVLGLDALRQAASISIPVFALGRVTLENAQACREAGASGLAAIRLFQENSIATIAHLLRSNNPA